MRWTERQRAMLREMGIELVERATVAVDAPGRAAASSAPRAAEAVAADRPMRPAAERSPVAERLPDETPRRAARATSAAAGSLDPTWLVVGEPFESDGPAGRLLDNMLRAIDVSRTSTRSAQRADVIVLGESPEAIRATLRARLRERPAVCVVALGRAAAQAVLGGEAALGALRGAVHRVEGAAVVVTFSLAYLLRHPADKAEAWRDLCLAVRTADVDADAGAEATASSVSAT